MALNVTYLCSYTRRVLSSRHRIYNSVRYSTINKESPPFASQPFPRCQDSVDVSKVLNGPKNYNRNKEYIYLKQYIKEFDNPSIFNISKRKVLVISLSVSISILLIAIFIGVNYSGYQHKIQTELAYYLSNNKYNRKDD